MAKKQYNVKTSAVAATERRARKYGVAGGSGGSGTYIDIAGDVAGKLDRDVFESMFERVVTGTDDEGNEKWYIKAKATLVSVGDVVAYGVSDITGGAGGGSSTLANLKDVLLGTPMDGDVIKWDASLGKWVNDKATALGDYVTVDTEQTITALKTFSAGIRLVTDTAWSNVDRSIPFGLTEDPSVIKWYNTNATSGLTYNPYSGALKAASFVKRGGASSQFLKADGSVDGTEYLYHRRTAEGFDLNAISAAGGGLYETYNPSGGNLFGTNWHKVFDWGADDNGYRVQMFTTLTSNSSMFFRHKFGGNWYEWRELLDNVNYANYLDSSYVKKAGDTMTGALTVPLDGLIVGSDGGDTYGGRVLRAYADSKTGLYINLGHDPSVGNCGEFSFSYAGAASASNSVSMGFYGGRNLTITYGGGISWDGNTIWHAGNDGSGSGLDADLLDGLHASSFVQQLYLGGQTDTHGAYVVLCPAYSGSLTNGGYFYGSVTITRGNAWAYNAKSEILVQCGGQYNSNQGGYQNLYNNVGIGGLYVITYNGTSYIALCMNPSSTMEFRVRGFWSGTTPFLIDAAASGLSVGAAIATTPHINSNALSASKLQTARTLYISSYNNYKAGDGVAFDGSGDVTLKLPNSITASDWFRSYGASGWYNQDFGGGIYMSDTTWIRTFNNKSFYCNKEILAGETFNRMSYGGSSWNNGYGAYNVDIYNNVNQTPLLLAYRDGAGVAATGANRLFAMELLNNGAQLNFGFGGAARFYFYSGGTFVATGDVTAYSDARLKSDIRPLVNRGFVEPKTYIKDGKRSIGFLAQDVRAIYPELVTETGGADNWLALNYGNLVAVLEAQIIDHEERIKRLEERA